MDNFDYIHAAILFADIENSVMLSATLPPHDYDDLLNGFHAAMQKLVNDFKEEGYPVSEFTIAGDQLSIFFYDPAEIDRNTQLDGPDPLQGAARDELISVSRQSNSNLVLSAMKAAIQLKNRWLLLDFNLRRVRQHREPLGLGIGLNYGQVYLRERSDGRVRIEGFAVNLAKRIESFARHGRYSHVMLSQQAHDKLRGIVVRHTQLRQRVYFHQHELELELLKGVTEAQAVFELKFHNRLSGVRVAPEVVEQYEAMFYLNPRNIWAYYQLFEHYAYVAKDWDRVLGMLQHALLAHPRDERLLLDLSRYYFTQGNLRQARELAEQALALNPGFDLAYEHLSVIARDEDDLAAQIRHLGRAVGLAPGSPINNLNLGLALCEAGDAAGAAQHLAQALEGYPEYMKHAATREAVLRMQVQGRLPQAIARRFDVGVERLPLDE